MTPDIPDRMLADPASLLPSRRADEAARLVMPLTLLADVPLGADSGGTALRYLALQDAAGTRIGVPARLDGGVVRRAIAGDGAAVALVSTLAAAPDGLVVDLIGAPVELSGRGERFFDVDQTNELVVVDEAVVVKWLLHPGHDGDVGIDRLSLLARARFDGVPALRATVRTEAGDLVATVTDLVPDADDGWTWAVDLVRRHAHGGGGEALDAVRSLGVLVGRMHAAFAEAGVAVADPVLVAGWVRRADHDATAAGLPSAWVDPVQARLRPIAGAVGTPVIAIHGDLHIGQVLRGPGDRYVVIDFDGSPLLSADERAEPAPTARDVAGMLASLDHVGRVVIHRTPALDEEGRARVLAWIQSAQESFLAAYQRTMDAAGRAELLDAALVDAFQVQQECREYAYAARYLPHWRYVPDAALPALLERGPR